MMFTCTPQTCNDPSHRHGSALAASRASTKIVRNRKGRSLRVDIHCHYQNPELAAKVAPLNPAQYEPASQFANALTKEVNIKQVQDRGPKLSTIEVRLKDMDRMGVDIQAICPADRKSTRLNSSH